MSFRFRQMSLAIWVTSSSRWVSPNGRLEQPDTASALNFGCLPCTVSYTFLAMITSATPVK
jgi:hypothetical protein